MVVAMNSVDGSLIPNTSHLYRTVISETADALLVIDASNKVIDATPEIFEHFGYHPHEIIGRNGFAFLHPDDVDRCASVLLRELADSSWRGPAIIVRIQHAEGHWCDVEMLGHNRFDDPRVGGILMSLRDVSGPLLGDRVHAVDDYLAQSLATTASDGTCIFDANGSRAYMSASLAQVLGYSIVELAELQPSDLVHPDDVQLWCNTTSAALADPGVAKRVECRLVHKERGPIWIETTIVNLLDHRAVRGIVAHIRDIDVRRQAELELLRQARRDSLTELNNRAALMEYLRRPSVTGRRALLFADLDNFKQVNDRLGHARGDAVLIDVANALKGAVRPLDFVARNGGDEFCVVADDLEVNDADALAERIRIAVRSVTEREAVGISIGVAHTDLSSSELDVQLLAVADRHMYSEKQRHAPITPRRRQALVRRRQPQPNKKPPTS